MRPGVAGSGHPGLLPAFRQSGRRALGGLGPRAAASGSRAGRLAAVILALTAVLGTAGCASGAGHAGSSGSASGPAFTIDQDFPDPSVLVQGGTAYAFATNTPGFTVPFATSTDMKHWTLSGSDSLPQLPSWARPGRTWAPAVAEVSSGHFVMYMTAQDAASGRQCIGTATSTSPADAFHPAGDAPIVCPTEVGGAIDPSTFRDGDGSLHLVWKTDGNCCGLDTWIETAPLSADGLSLTGPPVKLLKQDKAWEGSLVEAPVLVRRAGEYVLFFSANDYGTDRYAIGTATGSSVSAPFAAAAKPFLSSASSGGRYIGPGGEDVVTFKGHDWFVFHSWDEAYSYRGMIVRPLSWKGSTPVLG